MYKQSRDPIGIFDSGIGGLTVASAIMKVLPNESIVYFGDTAHLPYGDKSTASIQTYSIKITDVLLQAGCKIIVIACNSASAAAYDLVKDYVGKAALVFNVIDPVVAYVSKNMANKRVGLIGTRQTIESGVYEKKFHDKKVGIEITSLATPLLAPMIEDGFFNSQISASVIYEYLSNLKLTGIKSIILGCTHYPIIKKEIEAFYEGKIPALDSAELLARYILIYLINKRLNNNDNKASHNHRFLVSDHTQSFEESTAIFFGKKVILEKHPLLSKHLG